MKGILSGVGVLQHAFRTAIFGNPEKDERPTYDPECPLEENIRLQLEWVTGGPVRFKTHGCDAFIFELHNPPDRIARVPIQGDANAQLVMDKEKDFSEWIRRDFPDDLDRFALVEDSYRIVLDDANGRDVHVEIRSKCGNLHQNLNVFSGYSPKFMAKAWLQILKPVVLVYEKRKLTHGDIKSNNILVDLTCEGDYAFRMADWGGHHDPENPRPPYEGTPMFQTKETLATGMLRPADDVRALQLTYLEMYAGKSMSCLAEAYPDAFELVPHEARHAPHLKHIPDRLSRQIPVPLFELLKTPYDNVSELDRALTDIHKSLEH